MQFTHQDTTLLSHLQYSNDAAVSFVLDVQRVNLDWLWESAALKSNNGLPIEHVQTSETIALQKDIGSVVQRCIGNWIVDMFTKERIITNESSQSTITFSDVIDALKVSNTQHHRIYL